jgi:PAS domain S-box-containing protein
MNPAHVLVVAPLSASQPTLDPRCYLVEFVPSHEQALTRLSHLLPDVCVLYTQSDADFRFLSHIRERFPSLACLSITNDAARSLAAGADDVVALDEVPLLLAHRLCRLAESADQSRALAEAAAIFEQDNAIKLFVEPTSGRIVKANTFASIFYGYAPDDILHKMLNDLDAQPARQMMQEVFEATGQHSTYFVFKHRLASGDVREMEMYSYPAMLDAHPVLFIICHDVTVRLHTEQALRESEERYRTLVETASDLIFVFSPDGHIIYLSPQFDLIFGWAAHEWIGRVFIPLLHFEDLNLALEVFERALRGETLREYELRFNTARGDYGIGEFVVQPQIHDNKVIGVWGTMRDVTARRQAELAAYEQRALAEALRDTAAAINSTLDLNELFDCVLTQLERVIPYDASNIMLIDGDVVRIVRSRGYAERGLEESVMSLRFRLSETANMRQMIETRHPFIIGDTLLYAGWQSFAPVLWIRSYLGAPICIDDEVIGFLNIDSETVNAFTPTDADQLLSFANQVAIAIRNARLYSALRETAADLEQRIIERTRELERERAQLHAILEAMSEGVIYDEDLDIRYINRAMAQMVGFTADHWHTYESIYAAGSLSEADATALTQEIYDAITDIKTWKRELYIRRHDGSQFFAGMTVSPVKDLSTDELIGAVTVIRDISQEKALQEQKARFVAHASHELRTPLTNMKTRLYLLRRQPEQMARHLEILESVTNRMRDLVENLLDMSRFENGIITLDRQPTSLNQLVTNVMHMQLAEAEQKQISLSAEVLPEDVHVSLDGERMVQVLTNLLMNAINYTPSGGQVLVRIRVHTTENPPGVSIAVIDNGVGIAPEHIDAVFQPFFRVENGTEGTGLGLSISREIVLLHGGTIGVESRKGLGSTFTIWLPLTGA